MTGAEFRERRKSLALTQAQLADVWGVHPRTIIKWEAGERPVSSLAEYCLELMTAHPHSAAHVRKRDTPAPQA